MRSIQARSNGIASKTGAAAQAQFQNNNLGLSFYEIPPNVEISIREFEETVLERLKLLHAFDRLCGYETRQDADHQPKMLNELQNQRLRLMYPSGGSEEAFLQDRERFIKRDATSHFALRLAFCKTKEARDWFVRQELRLFVLRFDQLTAQAKDLFLNEAGVGGKKFDEASSAVTVDWLLKRSAAAKIWGDGGPPKDDRVFYEMPFYEAHPSLISSRRVVINNGIAYVPSNALKLIVAAKFKEKLIESLETAQQMLPMALADPRVGTFLRTLQEHGMQLLIAPKSSGEDVGEKLTLDNFEELLVRSFPPCMRRQIEAQRETKKHLKHAGRLQLRPFLKDCGFDIEESTRWWKKELCLDREIDATTFEKNYTYDIEHTYGKKGNFQGQNSFGCPKLIGFPGEGTGQVHGCVFKQLDIQPLKNQLHKWRIPESNTNEIEKLIKGGNHYQLACIEYFKALHPQHEGDGVGNSPNDFFRESCRCHKPKEASTTSVPASS